MGTIETAPEVGYVASTIVGVGKCEVGLTMAQIKYFKEKRVQDYKRDMTIKKIQDDDAKMAAKSRAEKKGKGWLS